MEHLLRIVQQLLGVASAAILVIEHLFDLREKYRRWRMTRRQKKGASGN